MAADNSAPNSMVLTNMLNRNEKWVVAMNLATDGKFFPKSAEGQYPKGKSRSSLETQIAALQSRSPVLWIGCADSRVPESVITSSYPGEIFVQRNIANQFLLDDDNAVSVLSYAVGTVEVDHIIVVGHTRCGGVEAAWNAAQESPSEPGSAIERWLVPLTEFARKTGGDVATLTEANVGEQVRNVLKSEAVKNEWRKRDVHVHGWMYELETGKLHDLGISVGRDGPLQF